MNLLSAQSAYLSQFQPPKRPHMNKRGRFTIKFGRKYRLNSNGEDLIELKCFIQGEKLIRSTGIFIKPKHWNENKQEVRQTHPSADLINLELGKILAKANKIAIHYELADVQLTKEDFAQEYDYGSARMDFILYFSKMITEKKKTVSHGTYKNHKKVYDALRAYRKQIIFSDLTNNWMKQFKQYLTTEKGQKHNTSVTYLRICRTYLLMAKNDGIAIHDDIFKGIAMKEGVSDRISLSKEELKKLHDLYTSGSLSQKLNRVIHPFLWSCYTGMRLGDVKLFNQNWISENEEIVFEPAKTKRVGKKLKIPLNKKASSLLPESYQFDLMSEQKMNEYLKEVMKVLGIRKNITYHCSRHTFATLFLEAGGSVEVLQNLLGHSKIEQTMVYVHLTDKRKRQQIELLDLI